MNKFLTINGEQWQIKDGTASEIQEQARTALAHGSVAVLELLDSAGEPATVYLNGKTTATVAISTTGSGKPTEISG